MDPTFSPQEIMVGYHPDGYRIDKTTVPLNWYTKWKITNDSKWRIYKPVPFESLPQTGWIKKDRFSWKFTKAYEIGMI